LGDPATIRRWLLATIRRKVKRLAGMGKFLGAVMVFAIILVSAACAHSCGLRP